MELEDLASRAIDYAQKLGAQYADARGEQGFGAGFLFENGKVEHIATGTDEGLGVRALVNGAWGFYATAKPTLEETLKAAESAVTLARGSSRRVKRAAKLAEVRVLKDRVKPYVKVDPEARPLEDLVEIAKSCDEAMRDVGDIIHRSSIYMGFRHATKIFQSSEGSSIAHDLVKTTARLEAIAHEGGLTETTSTYEGGTGGLELLTERVDLVKRSQEIAKRAVELLGASTPEERKATVIMDPDFVALLTHEIMGHPSEADRVLGWEMAWAGGAWWSGKLGEKVGSDALNVSDDPRIEGNLGYYLYDDEGVPAEEKILIKNGFLLNHIHSRETAAIFNAKPNAGMRASGYEYMPLIRMANTFVKPGDWTLDEMLKDVKDGVLVCGAKIPSIDMLRYNWSISCQWAYRVEKGEPKELLRDVLVMGLAPEFFKSVDACGKHWEVRPVPNCGKGDPMQTLEMGNGGPHIRGSAMVKGTTVR